MTKTCPVCHKTFTAKDRKIYCSEKCRRAHDAERKREQRQEEKREKEKTRREPPPQRTCVICGKDIPPESRRIRYCSAECDRVGKKRRDRKYYKKGLSNGSRKPSYWYDRENKWEHCMNESGDGFHCIRCTRPRAEGSNLCEYHLKIKKRIAEKENALPKNAVPSGE